MFIKTPSRLPLVLAGLLLMALKIGLLLAWGSRIRRPAARLNS